MSAIAEREPRVRLLERAAARLRRAGYLRKWLVLGAVIGVVGGLGAIVFTVALRWATEIFLGVLGGYTPPAPIGEGATLGSGSHLARPWAIPLVVGLGGLISGFLVLALAPEAEGHGTDAAIGAVHHNPKGIRARVSFVKIAASAITIGSGGSAGREGPTAQISAGFGSMVARWLDLTPADARIAVTVGIGAGIGAIFRAPLGGAILGAEVLYREDVDADALMPSLIASIIGFAVFGAVEGFTPIFGAAGAYHFEHPAELGYYAVIGLAAGLLGRLYSRSFYGVARLTHRMPGSRMLKPAVGGLLVGLMAIAVPQVLGTGYGWVQLAMGAGIATLPLWIVLALPFAKILATSLSIGTGGSGGIFGPGMVVGGFLGAAIWRLTQDLPAVPDSPAPFVVVGMIACFGSIAHAPLAVMLMVAEMTGTLEMLAPAMIAVGLASMVVGDATIYRSQLRDRTEAPAHRFRFGLPLLASLPIEEAMRPPRLVLDEDTTAREAHEQLTELGLQRAPVANADGVFRGSVDVDRLVEANVDEHIRSLADGPAAVPREATLDAVVEIFSTDHVSWVPVLDRGRHIVGVVDTADLVRAYRHSLVASLKGLRPFFSGSVFTEVVVRAGSRLIGRTISDADLPSGTVVIAVQRGEQLIFPEPSTPIAERDVLSVLVPRSSEVRLRDALGGDAEEGGSDTDPPMI